MEINFDPALNAQRKISSRNTETYVLFRSSLPKPGNEDAHLRHILRFYITRSLQKRGEQDIYVLPNLKVGEETIRVDVLAVSAGRYIAAICEPASITQETEKILETLKGVENVEVIVVHSQFGNSGNVATMFEPQIASKKFNILAVVPPPFDDVYEYDIWMFETTFRQVFSRE
jgi:hypothetical protein